MSDIKQWQVQPEEAGKRVDVIIAPLFPSRQAAQAAIAAGRVQLNGRRVIKPSQKPAAGEVITIMPAPAAAPASLTAEPIALDVVYEDEDVIVINKPRGMVVHPAPGHSEGTLVHALLHHCRGSLSGIGGVERPGIVHRLDKDTSGAIMAAKNNQAHLFLARQLKERKIKRTYIALVHGRPPAAGKIDAPIGRRPLERKKMGVIPTGRPAVSYFRVLEYFSDCSLLEVELDTGRTHQIRVHLAHIGYPVVGDNQYGRRRQAGPAVEDGQLLHAWRLSFPHPRLGITMSCVAFPPPVFGEILADLRKKAGENPATFNFY
ncbi:MAG TPA: RluA family pseudouridine synthase [Firmicutes bacterium]|nr:RluA family pseudouridine synthase [Bacillota bacterium]